MLGHLNHCLDIDARYASRVSSKACIGTMLRARGAPANAYILSFTEAVDGKVMPLYEAIVAAESGGWGAIVSCVAGRLAYYYDECGERRILLERSAK
jgi:hypothetical protein